MGTKITAPCVGRIVEVAFATKDNGTQRRCALVVRTWHDDAPSLTVNLEVHLDGANDSRLVHPQAGEELGFETARSGRLWLTSVGFDADGAVGKWRYLPPESRTIDVP